MKKIDFLQYNFSNIQELIRFIDQKAGALLVIYGFILTITLEFAKDLKLINPFKLAPPQATLSVLVFLVGSVLIGLLTYQIYIVIFNVLKPRDAKSYTQEEISILYFKHIAEKTKDEYLTHINSIPDEEFKTTVQDEFIKQVYEISCIMKSKSESFNSILKYLFYTVALMLVFIFLSTNL